MRGEGEGRERDLVRQARCGSGHGGDPAPAATRARRRRATIDDCEAGEVEGAGTARGSGWPTGMGLSEVHRDIFQLFKNIQIDFN
jgi:hypothetical protein